MNIIRVVYNDDTKEFDATEWYTIEGRLLVLKTGDVTTIVNISRPDFLYFTEEEGE